MSDKLHKVLGYLGLAASGGFAYWMSSPLAQQHPQVTQWLGLAMAMLAAIGFGVIKPVASGSSSGGGTITKLTPIALAIALFASGCAGWPVFEKCAKPTLARDAQALFAAVIEAAAQQDYLGALGKLYYIYGDQAHCVEAAIAADKEANSPSPTLKNRLMEHLGTLPKDVPLSSCGWFLSPSHS